MASGQPNLRHTHVYMQLHIQGTCTHAYSCPKVQLVKVRGQGCRCSLELGPCPYILWDESIELRRISSPKGPECLAQSSSGAFSPHQPTGQGEPCCISEFTIHQAGLPGRWCWLLADNAMVSPLLCVLPPLGSERALAINADYMSKASVSGANSLPLGGLAIQFHLII